MTVSLLLWLSISIQTLPEADRPYIFPEDAKEGDGQYIIIVPDTSIPQLSEMILGGHSIGTLSLTYLKDAPKDVFTNPNKYFRFVTQELNNLYDEINDTIVKLQNEYSSNSRDEREDSEQSNLEEDSEILITPPLLPMENTLKSCYDNSGPLKENIERCHALIPWPVDSPKVSEFITRRDWISLVEDILTNEQNSKLTDYLLLASFHFLDSKILSSDTLFRQLWIFSKNEILKKETSIEEVLKIFCTKMKEFEPFAFNQKAKILNKQLRASKFQEELCEVL